MSLTPERWQEVIRLFDAASALAAAEREAYLARECPDAELLVEVQRMLAAASVEVFLEPPPLEEASAGRDLGDFTLLEEIGRGGMGVVYRALQRPLQRVVAIKVLPASFALTPRQIDRFQREARAAARLSHPNLVTVLTVGDERGVRFFAMEYVDGRNLADELNRLRADLAPGHADTAHLPSSRASDYFRSVAETIRQAADGLAYAHENGVVHRDIKPSNLLLDTSGRVKIVDFGLARDEEQGSLSTSGDIAGTPHYMSPEQARAHKHQIDHRTDIYSLGVVLYELLTLKRPFEGKTSQEVITNLLHREPPRIRKLNPRVPRDLETICKTAMAREPKDRYSMAGSLRDDLAHFLAHEAIEAKPPGPRELALGWAYRHRRALMAAGIALLAGLIGVFVTQEHRRRSEITAHVDAIVAARAEGTLENLPPARALDLRRRLAELKALGGVRAAEADDAVQALERDFDALRTRLRDKGLADLAFAKDTKNGDGAREERRLSGVATLFRASTLFPEDDELSHLASIESAWPTIAVQAYDESGEATPAQVYLRAVDVFTSGVGAKVLLGATPLPPTAVLPGYYRVIVAFQKGGFRELVCNPGPASFQLELTAIRRPDEESIPSSMVLIPGGSYTFPNFEGEPSFQGKIVQLDSFWVDSAETTNLQYAVFARATGAPLPRLWRFVTDQDDFLRDYGDYPVVSITWYDAVACAEWYGKRLLTAAEWQRVAGGPENWPTPYSPDPLSAPRGNVSAPANTFTTAEEYWQEYLLRAVGVRTHLDARSVEGLFHLYGNVAELTESMAFVLASEAAHVQRPFDRLQFGQAWSALAGGQGMRLLNYWGLGPNYALGRIGFRCAKSTDP